MGYFMRFLLCDPRIMDVNAVGAVLVAIDPRYSIRPTDLDTLVEVYYDDTLYGQIEVDTRGDEMFPDDINAFTEMLGQAKTTQEIIVADSLKAATQIIAVEMFWEGTNGEATFEKFDPLWDWLFTNRKGILQADTEGFYDAEGLLVERKFMI
ncbi:MAG: hypothetical protein GC179_26190 [Anaerolineaceae bacterium]|nr:hypothetical protein [Anaerolineaceae bacterium]